MYSRIKLLRNTSGDVRKSVGSETVSIFFSLVTLLLLTDHSLVIELFKGRNLTGRLLRRYLIIQKYQPTFKYLPDRTNKVADSLFRNVGVGAVAETLRVI